MHQPTALCASARATAFTIPRNMTWCRVPAEGSGRSTEGRRAGVGEASAVRPPCGVEYPRPTVIPLSQQRPVFPVVALHPSGSDAGRQRGMGLHARIRDQVIGTALRFIPDEVLAPQLEESIVDHPIVVRPDGSHVALDILVPHLLRRVADALQVA